VLSPVRRGRNANGLTGSNFAHGGEERNSFEDNVAFAISLEVDDNPSAQNSLQTNSFPVRQASMPCGVNANGSPQ
jgi:hypothetical protein